MPAYVSPGLLIRGDVESTVPLRIDGRVTGSVFSSDMVTLGPSAEIGGDLVAGTAVIEGRVAGRVQVKGLVELGHSAFVEGGLYAARLEARPGCVVTGPVAIPGENVSGGSGGAMKDLTPLRHDDKAVNSGETAPEHSEEHEKSVLE